MPFNIVPAVGKRLAHSWLYEGSPVPIITGNCFCKSIELHNHIFTTSVEPGTLVSTAFECLLILEIRRQRYFSPSIFAWLSCHSHTLTRFWVSFQVSF